MKRTTIAVIVFVVALVAIPTVVALAQSDQSGPRATACPYNGEGGPDHLAMHEEMADVMGQMDMGQMAGMMGRMAGMMGQTGMGQMDTDQMAGMMGRMDTGQMDMGQMASTSPDVAR